MKQTLKKVILRFFCIKICVDPEDRSGGGSDSDWALLPKHVQPLGIANMTKNASKWRQKIRLFYVANEGFKDDVIYVDEG